MASSMGSLDDTVRSPPHSEVSFGLGSEPTATEQTISHATDSDSSLSSVFFLARDPIRSIPAVSAFCQSLSNSSGEESSERQTRDGCVQGGLISQVYLHTH